MKFCHICGAQLDDSTRYCPKCGTKIYADQPVINNQNEQYVQPQNQVPHNINNIQPVENKQTPVNNPQQKKPVKKKKEGSGYYLAISAVVFIFIATLHFFVQFIVSFQTSIEGFLGISHALFIDVSSDIPEVNQFFIDLNQNSPVLFLIQGIAYLARFIFALSLGIYVIKKANNHKTGTIPLYLKILCLIFVFFLPAILLFCIPKEKKDKSSNPEEVEN